MNDNNEPDDLKQLRDWLFVFGILFIFVFLVVGILLWAINVVPIRDRFSILEPKEYFEYFELRDKGIKSVIEGLKVLATIFGGIAILGNLFYAAKRAKALDASAIAANATAKAALENARAALKNAEAAQEKQITERFTKAVEQLASPEIAIRLGGIYALERIAKNSKDDHWTIMEVLTAFVREKRPLEEEEGEREPLPKIPTDIQAALTVIGRRNCENEEENQRLDLHSTDIRGADLTGAILRRINLFGADLREAKLFEANLEQAYLRQAKLQEAVLCKARLHKAVLTEANLEKAHLMQAELPGEYTYLNGANLKSANLGGANLYKTIFFQANLENANLRGAILKEAVFSEANLQGVDFSEANLEGANLSEAKNLKQEQIEKAFGNKNTTCLPENLKAPEHWTYSK
jgi:uncharacterized protein YjbI with pentapeptide repeats